MVIGEHHALVASRLDEDADTWAKITLAHTHADRGWVLGVTGWSGLIIGLATHQQTLLLAAAITFAVRATHIAAAGHRPGSRHPRRAPHLGSQPPDAARPPHSSGTRKEM